MVRLGTFKRMRMWLDVFVYTNSLARAAAPGCADALARSRVRRPPTRSRPFACQTSPAAALCSLQSGLCRAALSADCTAFRSAPRLAATEAATSKVTLEAPPEAPLEATPEAVKAAPVTYVEVD